MQEIKNRVILVTGATDGLGKRVAHVLAARGATVLLHGRNKEKAEAVLEEIRVATGARNLFYYNADFSSLDDVRRLCAAILRDRQSLDVLINNVGIGPEKRQSLRRTSKDGFELRFAVNYLAPYLLTYGMIPLLRASAPARIVNVASAGQQDIDFDNVMLDHGYDGLRAYRQSKLAQIMFTFDLAAEWRGSGIVVNCLHPATLMPTRMVLETDYFTESMDTVADGAKAVVYLATSPELENVSGEYFNGKQRARAIPQAYDLEARRRLRMLSRQLTGVPGTESR